MEVLGPSFGCHPVWNLRCKTPEQLSGGQSTVPWHQDTSYLAPDCWDQLQLTAWVPLVPCSAQNGRANPCSSRQPFKKWSEGGSVHGTISEKKRV